MFGQNFGNFKLNQEFNSDDALELMPPIVYGNQQQSQNSQQPQTDKKKSRRVRADQTNRDYTCGCGKSYLSYPALYTHIKQKHEGKTPQGTKKPQKNKGQRGRPSLSQFQQSHVTIYIFIPFILIIQQNTDNLSTDSNDAINIIEELVLYLFESLNNDISIILNENDQLSFEQIKQAFPIDKFNNNLSDYLVIQQHLQQICIGNFEEGQLNEDGLYDTKSLNEKGWVMLQEQQLEIPLHEEFCNFNNAQHVLEISNEFVTEILPRYLDQFDLNDFRVIKKQNLYKQIVNLTKYFCNWLYAKKYTNSVLQMNNDDENTTTDGFFIYQDALNFHEKAKQYFPEITIAQFSIGKTSENRDIYAYGLTLLTEGQIQAQGVLINSLHHAREVMSFSMLLFIPAINVDGYEYLRQNFDNIPIRDNVRKNRHKEIKCANEYSNGVDLNRNYEYEFAFDNQGSSNNPCDSGYRGQFPFSENETASLKKFLDERPNIRVAFNLHSYGNMWIMPFNYKNDIKNGQLKQYIKEYNVYMEFQKEAKFSNDAQIGNSQQTLGTYYLSNGECTDWMLAKKKIIAISPEIGKNDDITENLICIQQFEL
ncbi:zinc carboxypeptidase family protein, putative [Ichthyophthirius multifiliis]|uniref:Zinc carboxypeptidase family protein, putative n=1 Tax=Ichthyophthirius multifiliis TaxID=5932 RepID=G0R3C7_ICHMU|nr:zinc carboxypeptidase family protein, putative [Ichthyophthirius multifiliis]EGR28029.1 zinc carboxypeptidase family protein, putative [Ichthyophthirius multifiliis]|eukprot:XP_004027374.1 zinc carboxypeptidase family protein, putative [Ichthyophthirius multifiliis]